jgi:putative aldouronate transport system permease protein
MSVKNRSIRLSMGDRLFVFFNYLFLGLCFVVVAYPLIYIVSASVSDSNAVITGKVWLWPVGFDFRAYETVFESKVILTGYINSFLYTVAGTALNLVMTTLAAYPLARRDFYGKKVFTWYFLFTMFFSGGLIPFYIIMNSLHLVNNFLSMIVPGAISIWNMIIMRTFFQSTIPNEMYEAAHLDGCSDFRILVIIVLPLSKAIIAVMTLYYAVWHWNDYFTALIFITNPKLFNLQLILRDLLILNQLDSQLMHQSASSMAARQGMFELLRYAVIVVASVPVLMIYPFVQKYFIKGVMIGSLKG